MRKLIAASPAHLPKHDSGHSPLLLHHDDVLRVRRHARALLAISRSAVGHHTEYRDVLSTAYLLSWPIVAIGMLQTLAAQSLDATSRAATGDVAAGAAFLVIGTIVAAIAASATLARTEGAAVAQL